MKVITIKSFIAKYLGVKKKKQNMEFKEFDHLTKNVDKVYDAFVPSYILEDGSILYVEPNFYTQLINLKLHFDKEFETVLNSIFEITRKNKKVIFTADFDSPLILDKEDFIYRDINDVLAYNHLSIDVKINPESDWKD